MFTCSACLRRSLERLESDLPHDTAPIFSAYRNHISLPSRSLSTRQGPYRRRLIQRPNLSIQHRSHATIASIRKPHHRRQLQFLREGSQAKNSPVGKARRKAPWALTKVEIRDAVARDRNRSRLSGQTQAAHELETEQIEDTSVQPAEVVEEGDQIEKTADDQAKQERRLMYKDKNLVEVYYKDPLRLADGVLQRLRASDIEDALRLVRASQTFEIKNIVSWNHCCDWLMAQGQVKQALSVYNEMKKRGQKPDAHTYTIMLRGLSQHVDKPRVVKEAVNIYNSIFAPNSAVTPSAIHTNAIINVCARGGDMDSLWAVAGRLPERGPGSPDRITFSTILNAIRENTIKAALKSSDTLKRSKTYGDAGDEAAAEERRILYAKAVEDGRKMWEDISHRWRRADLVIDEQLVCAMGRLLLSCGVDSDIEQVLDLVEATMNLRLKERNKQDRQQVPWLGPSTDSVNQKSDASKLPLKESTVYAMPGNNTLSMLLEACAQRRAVQHLCTQYWWILTNPEGQYQIKPDAGNVITYLRLLRMQRASSESYKLLADKWPGEVAKEIYRRASFVVAFSTCLRDKRNPNVFSTAQKLLVLAEEKAEERAVGMFDDNVALGDMKYLKRKQALQKMKKNLADMTPEEQEEVIRSQEGVQSLYVDPKILNYYLDLAIATTGGWNEGLRGKDDGVQFERHPAKNHTIVALTKLAAHSRDIKSLVKGKMEEIQNGDVPRRRKARALDPREGSRVGESLQDLLQLMRTMISGWDRCLQVHERFKKAGGEGLNARLMEGFFDRKREMSAYITRVENAVGNKMRSGKHFDRQRRRGDEEEEEDEELEKAEEQKADIERRIKAVLGDVNENLLESRMEAKNKKSTSMRRYGDTSNMQLNLSSRRQKQERDNLIENRMKRVFPREDYGTLNSDLEIVSGRDATSNHRKEQRRLSDQGFIKGLSSHKSRNHPQSILDRTEVRSAWRGPVNTVSRTN